MSCCNSHVRLRTQKQSRAWFTNLLVASRACRRWWSTPAKGSCFLSDVTRLITLLAACIGYHPTVSAVGACWPCFKSMSYSGRRLLSGIAVSNCSLVISHVAFPTLSMQCGFECRPRDACQLLPASTTLHCATLQMRLLLCGADCHRLIFACCGTLVAVTQHMLMQ